MMYLGWMAGGILDFERLQNLYLHKVVGDFDLKQHFLG